MVVSASTLIIVGLEKSAREKGVRFRDLVSLDKQLKTPVKLGIRLYLPTLPS